MSSSFIAILVTTPTVELAKKLAHELVSRKLVACANIIPTITSIYQWEGKIHEDQEQLVVLKTCSHLFDSISSAVRSLHTYDVPEIIALPIGQGQHDYLQWIQTSVQGPSS